MYFAVIDRPVLGTLTGVMEGEFKPEDGRRKDRGLRGSARAAGQRSILPPATLIYIDKTHCISLNVQPQIVDTRDIGLTLSLPEKPLTNF